MVCLAAGVSAEAVLVGSGTAVKLESIKKAALKGAEQPRERSQPLVRSCPACQVVPGSQAVLCVSEPGCVSV